MKREVKIIGISYSQSQMGSYVAVLSETNGRRKLPLIIKEADARSVALKLEKLNSPRPLTHDLVKALCNGFNIDCQEVCIYAVIEGIFYARMSCHNGVDDLDIDLTAGDAMAMSLLFECPLYVTEDVLSACGIEATDEGEIVESESQTKKPAVSLEDLKRLMQNAIDNEEYEDAAKLRDKINRMENDENK